MEPQELVLTSCRHSQQWSACVWDPSTGSAVHFYKNGGIAAPKTVTLVGTDFLLTCDEDKPVTHVWMLNSQEPEKKLSAILPEKAQALDVCPQSVYLAVGMGAKLYVWQLTSGKLFTIQKKHYQPITCVKFSNCGTFVIVGGQDGMLVVYKLASLVSLHENYLARSEGQIEPFYAKQDHSLPITDLFVGSFAEESRFCTVSSDNTCKMYNLNSGKLLLNLIFEEPLTSVVFDGPCWNLFVGKNSGEIQQFRLREPPRGVDCHVSGSLLFQGHEKRVTCLDLGIGMPTLVSGSEDNFVLIWEIGSRQILRRIEHKGAVTNVKCVWKLDNFFVESLKPRYVFKNLERDLVEGDDFVVAKIQDFDLEDSEDDEGVESDKEERLKEENERLRAVNKQLFDAAMGISKKYNQF